jgi:hypothetical protein
MENGASNKMVNVIQVVDKKAEFANLNETQRRFGREFLSEKEVIAKFGKKVKKICPGNAYRSDKSKLDNSKVCEYTTEYYENAKISCIKCNKLLMNEDKFKQYQKAVDEANKDRK